MKRRLSNMNFVCALLLNIIFSGHYCHGCCLPNLYEATMSVFSSPKLSDIFLILFSSALLFSIPFGLLCSGKLKIVRFSSRLFRSLSSLILLSTISFAAPCFILFRSSNFIEETVFLTSPLVKVSILLKRFSKLVILSSFSLCRSVKDLDMFVVKGMFIWYDLVWRCQ